MKTLLKIKKVTTKKSGLTIHIQYYKTSDGRKFKIYYQNSGSSVVGGFDSYMCLSQYDPIKGKWNRLEDVKALDMDSKRPNYFDVYATEAHSCEFFMKMEEHIKLVYC